MADTENDQSVDSTQQVASKNSTTKSKNPKRVAAGKAVAEKMKQAREEQKKALTEAQIIIANNQLKQPVVAPPVVEQPVSKNTRNVLTTPQ